MSPQALHPPLHRALRFVHPDLDSGQPGLALTASGALAMVESHASIRQAILLLLSTSPGERVMRPTYGCDLGRLVFAPNDETSAGLAIHYVRRALEAWEPRVEILGLDARRSEASPSRLDLELTYRVRATLARDQLQFSLNQAPESP